MEEAARAPNGVPAPTPTPRKIKIFEEVSLVEKAARAPNGVPAPTPTPRVEVLRERLLDSESKYDNSYDNEYNYDSISKSDVNNKLLLFFNNFEYAIDNQLIDSDTKFNILEQINKLSDIHNLDVLDKEIDELQDLLNNSMNEDQGGGISQELTGELGDHDHKSFLETIFTTIIATKIVDINITIDKNIKKL